MSNIPHKEKSDLRLMRAQAMQQQLTDLSGLLQVSSQQPMSNYLTYSSPSTDKSVTTFINEPKKEKSMLKTLSSDITGFIKDHKSTIYVVALLILVDHFLFQGAFRERLHNMMSKLVGKVEAQLDKKSE